MPFDAEVLVVGSGAGGASLAYACAKAGKSVLVLERGHRQPLPAQHDEQEMLIDKQPYDDRMIDVNGVARRLYIGGGVGGSTALFGAALMRPDPDDFHPGKHYADRLPRSQWHWPIDYDTLAPHYAEAESLFGVNDQSLPLHPINDRLMTATRRAGLKPFRLPLAIDPTTCLQCNVCPGYLCPTGARRSAAQLLDQANVPILAGREVERLTFKSDGSADGIEATDRATGKRQVFRARQYVLGAGAISSPLLLQRSGVNHPLLGRNYMIHVSPIVAGLFARPTKAADGFVKQLAFADYYFGSTDYPHKLGLVQSLPVPGPLMLKKATGGWLPRFVIEFLRRRMLPLLGIVEDLPNPENHVTWGANGLPRVQHRVSEYDKERGRRLASLMAGILKQAGATVCLPSHFASAEHVAHQCGTLRFGVTANDAVLDPDCRLFGHANVFAVDGSFLPTSLGVGPALTIIANALRVAKTVTREA